MKKRTISEARFLIESLMPLQNQKIHLPCPRCGSDKMDDDPVCNSLSRYANVYICDECGTNEAMRDFIGSDPLPLNEWSMAISF